MIKVETFNKFVEESGMKTTFKDLMPILAASLDLAQDDILRQIIERCYERMDELLILIKIKYDEVFTEEDMLFMVEFYKSPVFKKFMKSQAAFMNDIMVISKEWSTQIANELFN